MSSQYCMCQRPVISTTGAWVSNDMCILPSAHGGDHWWAPDTRPPIVVEDAE